MKTATLEISRYEAQAQYETYRSLCRSRFDQERPEVRKRLQREHGNAQRILWHAARGRKILKLSESFQLAGLDNRGWPKLAIERADHAFTWCKQVSRDVLAFGQIDVWSWERIPQVRVRQPGHSLGLSNAPRSLRAVVPTIPIHVRPAGRLDRYHILWEAEWEPMAPKDPILLQHIADDAWAVLAQWDLTEVERLVLSGRFQA